VSEDTTFHVEMAERSTSALWRPIGSEAADATPRAQPSCGRSDAGSVTSAAQRSRSKRQSVPGQNGRAFRAASLADARCGVGRWRAAVEPIGSAPRATEEAIIVTGIKPASWSYADGYIPEDDVLDGARARAAEVAAVPIGAGAGAALRFVAGLLDARNVVEIGTGCGVSGVWMVRGMNPDGVLTSVDIETEHQRLARQAFTEAGFASQRIRLISGAALEVLPRLTDGHYDLVFCDGDKQEYPQYLGQALRLLRTGGVVAFDNSLWHDRVADPSVRDPETLAIRETLTVVADHEGLLPLLLPVGDGLLLAKKL
jgi:predicted O-methyltransferase YrrM